MLNLIELNTPLKKSVVEKLSVGDFVLLNGIIFTARDKAHAFLLKDDSVFFKLLLKNAVIFHCGPVAIKQDNGWKIFSAGPTTSDRLNAFAPELIEKFELKAIVGKGGMNSVVLQACKKNSCVYLHSFSGCGALLAQCVEKVEKVFKLEEFGVAEAIWQLRVKNFPAIVSMDCNGNSLHEKVLNESKKVQDPMLKKEIREKIVPII